MRLIGNIIYLAIILIAISPVESAIANNRIALVIGNSEYQYATPLPNPRNDATAIGKALEDAGFEVSIEIDLDQRAMQGALRDFGLLAETADVALVYFAGHGIQVASQNYLLPTDAQLRRERDLIYEATPLSIVTAEVAQARKIGMVILDACRDNPLADNLRQSLGPVRSKLIGLGMARVEDTPPDTLIAFSTRFDQLAFDGTGDLSPFTEALVKHIEEPGLELNLFFRKVRDTVLDITANRQEPRTIDALGAQPFYFREPKRNQSPELADIRPLIVADNVDAIDLEIPTPRDADDDELSIEVMGMPSFGTIEGTDGQIAFGDQLTVADLKSLKFRPKEGEVGEAGLFLFVVRDGRGGVAAGRVPIDVIRSNEAPIIAELQGIRWPDIPLGITAPTDPDGDPMTVTVLGLPTRGTIKVGDDLVKEGDTLSIEALTGLTLDPNEGVAGAFTYEVADDHGGVSQTSLVLRLPGSTEEVEAAPIVAASETLAAPDLHMRNTTPQVGEDRDEDRLPLSAEIPTIIFLETVTASNIRKEPGARSDWVTSVPAGTKLKLLDKLGDRNWHHIELMDGRSGYIAGTLVRELDSSPTEAVKMAGLEVKPVAGSPGPIEEPEIEMAAVNAAGIMEVEEFKECESCPTMVVLPKGTFLMGSEQGDLSERPVRKVAINEAIAIGKYEVTVAQWSACASSGFCSRISDVKPGDEQRPVKNISWSDAESFIAWLRKETQQPYRLPTEAEWEYAARGGGEARFWWGDTFEEGLANCSECGGDWNRKMPSSVGSYDANPFGLHDMHGGVSEWVADCWIGDYRDAPQDGSARTLSFCPQRVLRGGSWRSSFEDITASSRFKYDAQVRYYTNGLRVARDMN